MTPEQFYEEKRLAGETYNITSNDHPNYHEPFYQCIFRIMGKYSDQQTAELREQLASEIESREHWQRQAQRYQKYHRELNAALERVKELEGLLTTWVKQNNYLRRHSVSDFDGIHNQTKNALKK